MDICGEGERDACKNNDKEDSNKGGMPIPKNHCSDLGNLASQSGNRSRSQTL